MGTKISLPSLIRTPGARAHPYPFQVSVQTYEFMQGAVFYAAFSDAAAGECAASPRAFSKIEEKFATSGLDKKHWDSGWEHLERYKVVFTNTIFQHVVILLRSHWDWYIRQTGAFVRFARSHVASPTLNSKQEKNLSNIGWKDVASQLTILEEACGISFSLSSTTLSAINEMSLVRNLGMHNRWEVDDYYLQKTLSVGWELKDIRIIEIGELNHWRESFASLLNETSFPIAELYAPVPDYP